MDMHAERITTSYPESKSKCVNTWEKIKGELDKGSWERIWKYMEDLAREFNELENDVRRYKEELERLRGNG